ncbi:putative glycosyltransferase [Nocardioides phosphati]|uniref:Glycosyltransferase n=1 Tax=Nocardioides phosphati TaxID=1867775 RepID=A0ABQ2N798_9ACTN|nr:mycofactocin biosynthesis glycosyltransferase MftF [Nocardioides phosphati]GGO85502.1 putative glycosyltransferase [Nocardioides phosphati]
MTLPHDRSLPRDVQVRLVDGTWQGEDGRALFGGSPTRMLFLGAAARRLLRDGVFTVTDARTAQLGRVLLDRGFAELVADRPTWTPADVTVVVPVKDRPVQLRRLLTALPDGVRVVVVDDGSADADASLAVTREHGARLLCHGTSQGPSAARNTGLRAVTTPLVAFLDSDVVPRHGWLAPLLAQLEDPGVGIVAPRIAALRASAPAGLAGAVSRYEAVRSSLDLGPRAGLVVPGSRVSYVPSACLVGRTVAFGSGFDHAMQVGEDVDLVWRTVAAGWLVRYVPASVVEHDHRVAPWAWLARKAFYGTSAAPLAQRHGPAVAPVVLGPWTVAAGLALLGQHRAAYVGGVGIGLWATRRSARELRAAARPWRVAGLLAPYGAAAGLGQCSAVLTRHAWPAALPAAVVSRRVRRAALLAAVGQGLVDWVRTRPGLDPLTFVALRRLDDAAYGAGLWWGAWTHRTTAPLRPAWTGLRRGAEDRGEGPGHPSPATSRRGRGTPRR